METITPRIITIVDFLGLGDGINLRIELPAVAANFSNQRVLLVELSPTRSLAAVLGLKTFSTLGDLAYQFWADDPDEPFENLLSRSVYSFRNLDQPSFVIGPDSVQLDHISMLGNYGRDFMDHFLSSQSISDNYGLIIFYISDSKNYQIYRQVMDLSQVIFWLNAESVTGETFRKLAYPIVHSFSSKKSVHMALVTDIKLTNRFSLAAEKLFSEGSSFRLVVDFGKMKNCQWPYILDSRCQGQIWDSFNEFAKLCLK